VTTMAVRARVRFVADDIWDTPDDGKRYEVIDGGLYVSPPPTLGHQGVVGTLHEYIAPYLRRERRGRLFVAPVGLVLDEENGLQPDLVYVSPERAGILTERGIEGAPDLVVEVLSSSTRARDRGVKMRRYAAAGIPHYWIADPQSRALEAYVLGERGYERTEVFGPGTIFRPALLPGLDIPIDDLWS
jgi:Uma2 family endonuclease